MSDATVRTYDPSEVVVSIAGPTIGIMVFAGYADGTFVKITRSGDAFDKKRGADGTVDRINKNAVDFEAELSLKRTSPMNAVLSGLLALDQLKNAGIFALTIKDNSGASLFEAPQAWIKKDPDVEYADSLGNYTWKFDTGAAVSLIAGN